MQPLPQVRGMRYMQQTLPQMRPFRPMNKSSTKKDRDPPLSVALEKSGTHKVVKSAPGSLEDPAGRLVRFFHPPRIVHSLGENERPAGRGRTKKNKRKTQGGRKSQRKTMRRK